VFSSGIDEQKMHRYPTSRSFMTYFASSSTYMQRTLTGILAGYLQRVASIGLATSKFTRRDVIPNSNTAHI